MSFIRFLKDWTLPVAIFVGAGLYFLFAYTPQLEAAAAVGGPVVETLFPVTMFFTLLFTFCKVEFREMIPSRWQVGVLMFHLVFAAVLVALILLLDLRGFPRLLVESGLACVAGPCASAAPVVVSKLRGNLNQMTFFVVVSSVTCSMLIPAAFPLLEPHAGLSFIEGAGHILLRLAIVLLLPLVLGWIVHHYVRPLYNFVKAHPNLPFYVWAVNLAMTSGITVRNLCRSHLSAGALLTIAALSLLLCLALFAAGWAIGAQTGHRIEAGQACGQKNTAMAIWISGIYLNPIAALGPGCYVLWQNFVNSYELWQSRRTQQDGKQ